jgi:hypothetical protein
MGGGSYPHILIAYQPLGYLNIKEDVARLAVSSGFGDWSLVFDTTLPEDAVKVLALQPLLIPFGDETSSGFAALYEIQGMKILELVALKKTQTN